MSADLSFAFWLGGLIATVLTMAIDWAAVRSQHAFFLLARLFPVRVWLVTTVLVVAWPVLLTAVLMRARERARQARPP
jgi:putative copper export protein